MSSQQRSAAVRRPATVERRPARYTYGFRQPGDRIASLAASWGINLDGYERAEREEVFARLHAEPDDDVYRGPNR